jgi:hypothetical protein
MWTVYSWDSTNKWWNWLQDFSCESEAFGYATEMSRNWFKVKVFYEACN